MTAYDIAMIVVILGGMIWGAWRGITWQLASIASLALGYIVAVPMSAELAPQFPGEPIVARALAMLVLYVAVSASVFAVAWSIRATLRRWRFEAYDRHLGMILGGFEGALLGVVLTIFVVSLAPQTRDPILHSPAGRIVDRSLKVVKPVLPSEVCGMLQPFWDELDGIETVEGSGSETEREANDRVSVADEGSEPPFRWRAWGNADAADADTDAPKRDSNVLRSAIERGGAEAGRSLFEPLQRRFQGRSEPDDERRAPGDRSR